MINKKSVWFLTLFSLILVLSVYYITMPSDLLLATNNYVDETSGIDEEKGNNDEVVKVEESEILVALRVESDEQLEQEMSELKEILTSSESTVTEKNDAYEKIKDLNNIKSEEKLLEEEILSNYDLKAFVKITGDQIRVIIDSKEHSVDVANNVMRLIQSHYETTKYITVKFQS